MIMHIIWRYGTQKVNVVVAMEASQLRVVNQGRSEDIHFFVEIVVHNQIMSHTDSMWLHRMALHNVHKIRRRCIVKTSKKRFTNLAIMIVAN